MDAKEAEKFFKENAIKVKQVSQHVLTAHAAAILIGSLGESAPVREIVEAARSAQQAAGKESGDG